jgi:hypothetical protein
LQQCSYHATRESPKAKIFLARLNYEFILLSPSIIPARVTKNREYFKNLKIDFNKSF